MNYSLQGDGEEEKGIRNSENRSSWKPLALSLGILPTRGVLTKSERL